MHRFKGAVALVTGASAGIGEAIARQLTVDHGMKVVGCARRITRLQAMEKDFEEKAKATGSGGKFYGVQCDLDKDEDIRKMFDWIKGHPELGQVYVCICNAGIFNSESLMTEPSESWRKQLNVNVVAPSLVTQLALNLMLEKGITDGQVIFINSTSGHQLDEGKMSFYNASKLALTCVVHGWRKTVQGLGVENKIRIGQVSPGLVKTEIFEGVKPSSDPEVMSKEVLNEYVNLDPDHIAHAVVAQMSVHPDIQIRDTIITHVAEKL